MEEQDKRASTVFNESAVRLQLREQLQHERLAAYKEDLAEWLAGLFHTKLNSENLVSNLENGTLLCQLAVMIESGEIKQSDTPLSEALAKSFNRPNYIPAPSTYKRRAAPGSFQARDNVAQFIDWLKGIGVAESILFEASDLVDHKNEKNVLYSLMELGRKQYGVNPPTLVELERNIDRMGSDSQISEVMELELEHDIGVILKKMKKEHLPPTKIGPNEYQFGHIGPFKVVKLRDHVMVRLPNTWDTLEHVLLVYDVVPTSSRPQRRNSQVMDVVESTERQLSVAAALAQRRHSRSASVSDFDTRGQRSPGVSSQSSASCNSSNGITKNSLGFSEEIDSDSKGKNNENTMPELVALRIRTSETEENLARATTEVKELLADRKKLQQMYDEEKARTRELEMELKEAAGLESEHTSLQNEADDLRKQIQELKLQISNMSDAVQASDYFKNEMERLRSQLTAMTEEHHKQTSSQDARLKNKEELLSRSQEQVAVLKKSLEDLKSEQITSEDSLNQKMAQLQHESEVNSQALKKEHEEQIASLAQEITSLEAEREHAIATAVESIRSELVKEREEQQQKHEQLQSALKEKINKLEAGEKNTHTKNQHLHEEVAQLKKRLAESERDEVDKHMLQTALSDKEATTATYRDEVDTLKRRIQELENEIEDLKRSHEAELAILHEKHARDLEEAVQAARTEIEDNANSRLISQAEEASQLATELENAQNLLSDLQQMHQETITKLQENEEKVRVVEAHATELQATSDTAKARVEELKSAHKEELDTLRNTLSSESEQQFSELTAQMKAAQQECDELRERTSALESVRLGLEEKLLDADETCQTLQTTVQDLKSQQTEQEQLITSERQDWDTRLNSLRKQLEEKISMYESKLETSQTELKLTLESERAHYEAEISRLKNQLQKERDGVETVRQEIEDSAASKLKDAQRKVESLEALAQSRKERFDNEIKLLRLRCMEAERKESSVRMERDMLTQKMSTVQLRKEELEKEVHDVSTSYRLKLEDMQHQLTEVQRQLASQQSANEHPHRFARMSPSHLSPEDVDLICIHDEETRLANITKLRAQLDLAQVNDILQTAVEENEVHGTPNTFERLERAKNEQKAANQTLQDAEAAFLSAASRALERLQQQEQDDPHGLAVPTDGTDAQRLLLQAHANAQVQIAELEREVGRIRREKDDELADKIMELRIEHSSKLQELANQRSADKARINELEHLVKRLQSRTAEASYASPSTDIIVTNDKTHSENAPLLKSNLTSKERRLFSNMADWINLLLETDLNADSLIGRLRDGKILCQLANVIDDVEEKLRELEAEQGPSDEVVLTRECLDVTEFIRERDLLEVQYLEDAEPGNSSATNNVRAFIEWAECLGLKNPSVFEVEDLLDDQDHRQVIDGIMNVAFRVRGLPLPSEVEKHRAAASLVSRSESPVEQYLQVRGDEVDKRVAEVLNFVPQMKTKLKRVAKGKYRLGDDKRLLLMRVLRDNVMVRVGGGWMDLREYLVKHAERSRTAADYGKEAQATVQDILKSTGGPGLCSTRTTVPQRRPRTQKRNKISKPSK